MSGRTPVVGYTRVSTAEQAENGGGLDIQQQAIRSYCREHGLRLVRVVSDAGQSGSNGLESRVGLSDALIALEDGDVRGLVVYRLDRLARDVVLQETLVRRIQAAGAAIYSTTEDDVDSDEPTRVLVRQMVGVIGEYERKLIRARMMAGRAAKRKRGGFIGGRVSYGFRVENGEVLPDPAEQEVVEFVVGRREAGESLRQIIVALNEAGYRPRSGEWHPTMVARIARSSPGSPTPG